MSKASQSCVAMLHGPDSAQAACAVGERPIMRVWHEVAYERALLAVIHNLQGARIRTNGHCMRSLFSLRESWCILSQDSLGKRRRVLPSCSAWYAPRKPVRMSD
jgi:hypothetical protein